MTRKRTILLTIIGLLVLLLVAEIAWPYQHPSSATDTAALPSAPASPGNDDVATLKINGTRLVSGPKSITIKQNSNVRVNLTSAGAEVKVQLEGYDIISEASPQAPGALDFTADKTGTFTVYALGDDDEAGSSSTDRVAISKIIVK